MQHYNQEPKRQAEFIRPINALKQKVGSGGLSDDILKKAQDLLENNDTDFAPLAEIYLDNLSRGIDACKAGAPEDDNEFLISGMIYPAMQLKANGGMFHYHLITVIADKLVQFLEVIEEPDIESIEIVMAFHTTMKAVVNAGIKGDGGDHGANLINALNEACVRYFEKLENAD